MNKLNHIYNRCVAFPFGHRIFSKLVCFKAPYFGSIKPLFKQLEPGYCEIFLKKRRSITNHLNTVHAIAMCNISELAAGSMLEASIPSNMRWIPKEMTVSYLKMAKSDLTATCRINLADLNSTGDFSMTVHVTDIRQEEVFQAVIIMYLSEKKTCPGK